MAKPTQEIIEDKKRVILNLFVLCFPALIIAMLTMFPKSILNSAIATLMFFYQAVLLKNFIETK